MPETEFNEEYIKTTIKDFCENSDQCGFEAFVVQKDSPKLKRMSFDERENSDGNTFRTVLKNVFIEIMQEKYLAEEAEFEDGSHLADNQHKYLFFEQTERFKPFEYLVDENEIDEFKEDDLSSASGLAFKIRKGEKSLWLYQHLWGIMIPNKKKNNLMTRVLHFENGVVFSEQKDSLLTIARKIDIVVMGNYIITENISLLQKNFGFHDYIYQSANKTIDGITSKNLVKNVEKLNDYISRGKTKYAKKMMRISASKVFDLSREQLIEKVSTIPRWRDVFDIDSVSNEITLNTFGDVENLIDLFDERYTRSEVTDTEYDTDVKTVAKQTE